MPDDNLEKLLGGFATDTLTPEEKQRLYTTALHDQQLFNLFADEQALKELLTDPVVREKLLRSIRDTASITEEGTASWFGWFRRPSGLAWAGGLAVALVAVVLGTNIYQESLKEAEQSVARELSTPPAAAPVPEKPALPEINGSQKGTQKSTKSTAPIRKPAPAATTPKPETSARAKPKEARVAPPSGAGAPSEQPRSTREQFSPRSEEHASSLADQAHRSTPVASSSAITSPKPPTTNTPTAQVGSALSARSLFYGESPEEIASDTTTAQQNGSHSMQSFDRLTRKSERAANLGSTLPEASKPLGIRYSLIANERKGLHDERDASTALRPGSLDLMIESNQDSFFQVWGEADPLQPQLLFPFSAEDPVSSRLMTHQRRRIPILGGYRSLVVRLSRLPFDPLSTNNPNAIKPSPLGHLQESSSSTGPSGSQDQGTYVVNQNPTAGTFAVRIPIPKP